MCWGRNYSTELPELINLRTELAEAHYCLQVAYNQFEQVVDPVLIDAATYTVKAAELRYNWLLGQAKSWSEQLKEGWS